MRRIIKILSNCFFNFITAFLNLFVWRDKRVWLLGSWMGEKYADNTRFLYDYLKSSDSNINFKKIIWVTRDKKVLNDLVSLGLNDVCLIGSKKSLYYHLKAGVHFVCNSVGDNLQADIDSRFSFGAKKIQLWHGVGIKACGKMCRKKQGGLKNWFHDNVIDFLLKPGHWKKAYFLTTSAENTRVAIYDYGVSKKRIIQASYPRYCWNPRLLTDNEKTILSQLKTIRSNYKIVLFLPTFKKSIEQYTLPNSLPGFSAFLKTNNIFWIQKKHPADTQLFLGEKQDNVITIDYNFDINLIYEYIDVLLTDYSSATTDAIVKNKVTIEYCPDFDYYENEDRGFVNDFTKYHVGHLIKDPDCLFECISKNLVLDSKNRYTHNQVKEFLIGDQNWTIEEIVKEIIKKTKIRGML